MRSLAMKTFWALTFGMLFGFSLSPQLSAAPQFAQGRNQNQNRDRVCVYDRPNYQGREQCWSAGQDLSDLGRAGNWSDRISSIRVFGPAAVVLYRDIGFRGESVFVDRDIPNLGQLTAAGFRNWDRQAS